MLSALKVSSDCTDSNTICLYNNNSNDNTCVTMTLSQEHNQHALQSLPANN